MILNTLTDRSLSWVKVKIRNSWSLQTLNQVIQVTWECRIEWQGTMCNKEKYTHIKGYYTEEKISSERLEYYSNNYICTCTEQHVNGYNNFKHWGWSKDK